MSDERLPEENLFTVLLVILSHLLTMVFSVLFVASISGCIPAYPYIFTLETISLRPSKDVPGHAEAPCAFEAVFSQGRILREGRSSSKGVSAARRRPVVPGTVKRR